MIANVVQALEQAFSTKLLPLNSGAEARTFAGVLPNGQERVFKVFETELAHLEASLMRQAGLGQWVIEVLDIEGYGVLHSRRFPGSAFTPQRFTALALSELAQFFAQLHQQTDSSTVSQSRLLARLSQFSGTLHDLPQAQHLVSLLLQEVPNVCSAQQSFCHRDPHAGNVLLKHPEALGPEVLLVDWVRAGPDDPARDLAILTTGTLDLLGDDAAREALRFIVGHYPNAQNLWQRLRFWIPLTYLHDMHWFRTKEPQGFAEAVREKLPKAVRFYTRFPNL